MNCKHVVPGWDFRLCLQEPITAAEYLAQNVYVITPIMSAPNKMQLSSFCTTEVMKEHLSPNTDWRVESLWWQCISASGMIESTDNKDPCGVSGYKVVTAFPSVIFSGQNCSTLSETQRGTGWARWLFVFCPLFHCEIMKPTVKLIRCSRTCYRPHALFLWKDPGPFSEALCLPQSAKVYRINSHSSTNPQFSLWHNESKCPGYQQRPSASSQNLKKINVSVMWSNQNKDSVRGQKWDNVCQLFLDKVNSEKLSNRSPTHCQLIIACWVNTALVGEFLCPKKKFKTFLLIYYQPQEQSVTLFSTAELYQQSWTETLQDPFFHPLVEMQKQLITGQLTATVLVQFFWGIITYFGKESWELNFRKNKY